MILYEVIPRWMRALQHIKKTILSIEEKNQIVGSAKNSMETAMNNEVM